MQIVPDSVSDDISRDEEARKRRNLFADRTRRTKEEV